MLILFKFGAPEHLLAFREQGLLHMRTIRFFAEREANPARKDRFEGTAEIIQPSDAEIIFEHPLLGKHTVDPRELTGPVSLTLDSEANRNVFCMFALTKPQGKPLIHGDNLNFGTSFVLVLNTPEFLRRISSAAQSAGLQTEAGLVKYFDENKFSGPTGPFLKSSRYMHQSEYRIVVSPGIPIRELTVGSLEDITTPVLPLADIDSHVDFSPESARAAGINWDGEAEG
jgi:hypothetical protein